MARGIIPMAAVRSVGASWMKAEGLFYRLPRALPATLRGVREGNRADLCAAVYREIGGKWTARHKQPCPD
jgi:hypothetical protein